ncbi:MAG: hypothetical protein WBV23_10470 [Desulfobaccales bacterium]
MTLNEYRQKIFERVLHSNNKNEVLQILKEAKTVLIESEVSEISTRNFWINLYEDLDNKQKLICEKVAVGALSDIIAAAQEVIAKNIKQS